VIGPIGYGTLVIALVTSLLAVVTSIYGGRSRSAAMLETARRAALITFPLLSISILALLILLISGHFEYTYVYQTTDLAMPLYLKIAALWGGQEGSLLFWCWLLAGFSFITLARKWKSENDLLPWVITVTSFTLFFFLILVLFFENPFHRYFITMDGQVVSSLLPPMMSLQADPPDGAGLNPLLRHFGMVVHPPALYLGFTGFVIPYAYAIAALITGRSDDQWIKSTRKWSLMAWLFLSIGLVLGSRWAYDVLGWGGYWAWDPVENASLIPWFSATAFLHTSIIERRFGALPRTNVFLACLTLLLCIFATYLVRSGVVESLHAFGEGGVALPLILAISFGMIVSVAVALVRPAGMVPSLPGLDSKQGMVVLLVWLLIALGAIVLMGTLWPVISQLWETNPVGVNQGFYNTICLPLFTAMAMLLALAPWLGWKGGFWKPKVAMIPVAAWICVFVIGFWLGVRPLLAVTAVGAAVAVAVSVVLLAVLQPKASRSRAFLSSHGSHLLFAVLVLGVAVSGPFQKTHEVPLSPGENFSFGGYLFEYTKLRTEKKPELAIEEAVITVSKDGKRLGELTPQRRLYRNYDHPNSEVSTLFSLGDELYATIHDIEGERVQPLKVSINPMVNWVWIGSLGITLLPLLAWRTRRAQGDHSDE